MKKFNGWNDVKPVQDGEFNRPAPGGYVCVIKHVEDVPFDEAKGKGNYLKIELDIAEGDFKDYYRDLCERFGTWQATAYRSYSERALGMFKGFITAVEESNAGYDWAWDEKTLVGKRLGVVFGEEEYINRSGEIKTSLKPVQLRSVESIRSGDFKIPAKKAADPRRASAAIQASASADGFTEIDDAHLPF